ncbi:hypothetical protein C0J52_11827 [Blattella germanica]|nr:hypothetical protein C0J52_11827 [Blattella germanica]
MRQIVAKFVHRLLKDDLKHLPLSYAINMNNPEFLSKVTESFEKLGLWVQAQNKAKVCSIEMATKNSHFYFSLFYCDVLRSWTENISRKLPEK